MAWGTEDGVRYTYYEDLKKTVKDLGYSSAKEAIIDLYEKLGGCTPVAKKLGLTKTTVWNKLKAFRYPMKGRGGPNNPFGKKGKPDDQSYT